MTILELAQQHRDKILEAQSRPVYDNTPPVLQEAKPITVFDRLSELYVQIVHS